MRHRRGEEHELRIFCNHFCDRCAAASLLVLPCKLNLAPELLGFLVSYGPLGHPRNEHVCLLVAPILRTRLTAWFRSYARRA